MARFADSVRFFIIYSFCLLAALLSSLVGSCFTQSVPIQPGTPAVAPESSTILISARTNNGTPAELSVADIEIKADGKPATVNEVHRVDRGALYYCLLLDSRGSQQSHFKLQQDEATQLLSKVVQAGRDRGFLVSFGNGWHVDAEGADPQELVNAIAREQPGGGGPRDPAVVRSAESMLQSAPDLATRVMFILSDGDRGSSQVKQDEVVLALLKAGIRVYVVGQRLDLFGSSVSPGASSREADRDANFLMMIAGSTGGKAYFPTREKYIGKTVVDIADELANLFAVTYALPGRRPDGRLHKLEVKCSKKDVSITAPERTID